MDGTQKRRLTTYFKKIIYRFKAQKKVLKTVSPFQAQKQSKRTDQNNTEIQLIDPQIPTFNHQEPLEPKKKKKRKTHSKKRRDKIESGEMCFKNDETQDFYLKDGTLVEPDL